MLRGNLDFSFILIAWKLQIYSKVGKTYTFDPPERSRIKQYRLIF